MDAKRTDICRAHGKGSDFATLREKGSYTVATAHPGRPGVLRQDLTLLADCG